MIEADRGVPHSFVQTVNKHEVKENIKKIIGVATFVFGVVQLWNLCEVLSGRVTDKTYDSIANIVGIFSIILSAAVSRPGAMLITNLKRRFVSKEQTEKIWGKNINFERNARHPRHVTSFLAVILAAAGFVATDGKIRAMLLFNTLTCRPVLHKINQIAQR